MGRFKKHFKGVCWKRKSSDSDAEDESEKKKTPNGERSNVKGKKKQQKLTKEDDLKKRVIDLDLHMSKAVEDMLDKLDRLDKLNLEIINKFVGMIDVDRNNKVVRLVGECEGGKEEPKNKNVQQVSVNPDLVKVAPRISEVQLAQTVDFEQLAGNDILAMHPKEQLTMPYLQRDDILSVIHDFPDEEPACAVDESVDVKSTLAKCSLREVGTLTDDTHVSLVSTCSGPDTLFSRKTENIYVTPVEMKSIACETELLVESKTLSNVVLIDNGVQVTETKPRKTEMKSIAINTEVVESTKTGQPLSGLFNPTEVRNITPFDVYCKRVSVPEPVPLRNGESPYRCLFAKPSSKSRLSKFNLKIPRAFSNVNITHTVEEKSAKDLTTNSERGSLTEKSGTDTVVEDVDKAAPHVFGHKPTSDDIQATYADKWDKQQVVEPIHIPQLRVLCRKMFYDDKAHASNLDESIDDTYKLSGLSVAYINSAHQRLKASANHIRKGNMGVMPLSEMCCHLFGVGGLGKQDPGVGLNMENVLVTDEKQGYMEKGYQECFRPDLNRADMDEVDAVSVKGQFGTVVTSNENLKYPHVQLMAVVRNGFGSEPTLINIQQLRLICMKMFFDDLLHCSNQDKSGAGSYKLSDISMAYLNAAYQRLKAGTQCISEGNTIIYPLREMCRQLLGIALSKQGPLNGLHMGIGFESVVKPNMYQDIDAMVYFGPELPNTVLNDVDSLLSSKFGAAVTSDESLEISQSELMDVVPYISRSEPMPDGVKAALTDLLDKQPVVEPIHIPQLRMICRKMFFEDIPQASNQDESDTGCYKLSGLAIAYINGVQQQVKVGIYLIREGNMVVLPLREMCRQLFGIGRLQVKGQFGVVAISTRNMRSPKRKFVDHAETTVTRVKQLSRIPKLVLPTIDKGLTTPDGPITLKYLMERYGASGTFKEIHAQFLSYNLLGGLKFLHRKGIAHRFIFPRRIMFNSNGYPSLMSDIEVVGPKIQPRIEFSSPELITSGPITVATDIFQVGMLAYSFMYGRSPYKAAAYSETKMNLLDDNFKPQFENATMSRDGRYFIRKCLRKNPEMRFNLVKCKRSLEYVVNWFNVFKGEDLVNQKYASPFKDLVQMNT